MSLAVFVVASVTVNVVSEVIVATVLVSELTKISSPIETSLKNDVPTPVIVVLATGSIAPVKVKVSPSVSLTYKPNSLTVVLNLISSYIKVAPIGNSTPFKR